MLGRMWVNPCITTADDGTKNQIYLDIVDLDKNPRNRFVIILTKLRTHRLSRLVGLFCTIWGNY